jgi:hypothetical protein
MDGQDPDERRDPPAERSEGDDLFAVAPGEFIPARNALARQLRAQGDLEAAAAVGRLRKPPISAWALNQVARGSPELVAEVIRAGAALNDATAAAMAGDRSGLRPSEQAARRATAAVVAEAVRHLGDEGHRGTDAAVSRMTDTVRAALVDGDVAERLRRGTLASDYPGAAFAVASKVDDQPALGRTPAPRDGTDQARRAEDRAADRAEDRAAHRDAERAGDRAEQLEVAAGQAAREAEVARRESLAARQAADAAARAADDAETRAAAARRSADDAIEAAEAARRAVGR